MTFSDQTVVICRLRGQNRVTAEWIRRRSLQIYIGLLITSTNSSVIQSENHHGLFSHMYGTQQSLTMRYWCAFYYLDAFIVWWIACFVLSWLDKSSTFPTTLICDRISNLKLKTIHKCFSLALKRTELNALRILTNTCRITMQVKRCT